jgi:PTS system beta-glucosides-specific IIC component
MSKDYSKLAASIIDYVGGRENIRSVTNCMTRLRFVLKDDTKTDESSLRSLKGVEGIVNQGGQYQLVIGTNVSDVCAEIKKIGGFANDDVPAASAEKKQGPVSKVLGTITAIFQPIIPGICGAGMIKAVLALCVAFHWIDTTGTTYQLLASLADSAFYFLPIFLAFSSAKQFKCNPYLASVIGAFMIHPTTASIISSEGGATFFGISVKAVSYSSAVVAPILVIWAMSYIQRFMDKISPKAVKVFLSPLLTFLVTAPLALIVIGPLGSYIGDGLFVLFNFLNNQARWVLPVLMGTFTPLFVMTGMHYSFMPIQLAQYATLGYGTLLGPGMLASNIGQATASLIVGIKTKNKELKEKALSSSVTAYFGITEPAMYGVTLPLKKPLIAAMIGGGAAGLYAGLMNLRTYASATAGLLALPVYICDDLSNVRNAVITILISIAVTAIMTLILGWDDPVETKDTDQVSNSKDESKLIKKISVASPVNGKAISLKDVPDKVFSEEVMGKGIAIIPSDGTILSPAEGIVTVVFPTGHAVGITDKYGVEILVHIGIDTVNMNGDGFKQLVKQGDSVKVGTPLIEADLMKIEEKGYSTIIPIVITNTNEYVDVISAEPGEIKAGENLLTVIR